MPVGDQDLTKLGDMCNTICYWLTAHIAAVAAGALPNSPPEVAQIYQLASKLPQPDAKKWGEIIRGRAGAASGNAAGAGAEGHIAEGAKAHGKRMKWTPELEQQLLRLVDDDDYRLQVLGERPEAVKAGLGALMCRSVLGVLRCSGAGAGPHRGLLLPSARYFSPRSTLLAACAAAPAGKEGTRNNKANMAAIARHFNFSASGPLLKKYNELKGILTDSKPSASKAKKEGEGAGAQAGPGPPRGRQQLLLEGGQPLTCCTCCTCRWVLLPQLMVPGICFLVHPCSRRKARQEAEGGTSSGATRRQEGGGHACDGQRRGLLARPAAAGAGEAGGQRGRAQRGECRGGKGWKGGAGGLPAGQRQLHGRLQAGMGPFPIGRACVGIVAAAQQRAWLHAVGCSCTQRCLACGPSAVGPCAVVWQAQAALEAHRRALRPQVQGLQGAVQAGHWQARARGRGLRRRRARRALTRRCCSAVCANWRQPAI